MADQYSDEERAGFFSPTVIRRGWVIAVATVALGAVLAVFQSRSDFLGSAEYWMADWAVALASDQASESHDKVALALIREETLRESPAYSPIDRRVIARTVQALDELGPAVIGLDFVFDKETDPEATAALLQALRGARTPIVIGRFQPRGANFDAIMIPDQAEYQEWFIKEATKPLDSGAPSPVSVGYVNLTTEVDGVVRRFAPRWDEQPNLPSFAEALAKAAGAQDISVSTEDGAPRRIAWLRKPVDGSQTFPRMLVEEDLVQIGADGIEPIPFLVAPIAENRVVIVGAALRVMTDFHETPLNAGLGEDTIGVAIQAQLTAQLLDGRALHDVGPVWGFVLPVVAFVLSMIVTFSSGFRWSAEFGVAVVAYLGIFLAAFVSARLLLPILAPAIGWAIGAIMANATMAVERAMRLIPGRRAYDE